MEYLLKNGKNVLIRKPTVEDAEAIINIMTIADTETLFLARNPGEFCTPVEREKQIIENRYMKDLTQQETAKKTQLQ